MGDLFLLPSKRGPKDRVYVFRANQYANVMNRALDMSDIARNKLTMEDSYLSEDLAEELLIEMKGMVLGYAEQQSRLLDLPPSATTARALVQRLPGRCPPGRHPRSDAGAHGEPIGHRWALRRRPSSR